MARTRKVLVAGTLLMTVTALLLAGFVIPMGGRLIALFGVGLRQSPSVSASSTALQDFIWSLAWQLPCAAIWKAWVMCCTRVWPASCRCRAHCRFLHAGRVLCDRIIAYAEAIAWGVLLALYLGRVLWRRTKKAI